MRMVKCSDQEYFSRPAVNASALKKFYISPADYAHYKVTPPKDSTVFDFGKAVHALVLENKKIWKVVEGNRNSNAVKEEIAAVRAEGLIPVKQKDLDGIDHIYKALLDHPDAQPFFGEGEAEVAGFAKDPQTGLELKAKYDFIDHENKVIYDLKTVADLTRTSFHYDYRKFLYWIQEVHYLHVAGLLGLNGYKFKFIAVKKTPPHHIGAFESSKNIQAIAWERYDALLEYFAECQEKGNFTDGPKLAGVIDLDI